MPECATHFVSLKCNGITIFHSKFLVMYAAVYVSITNVLLGGIEKVIKVRIDVVNKHSC